MSYFNFCSKFGPLCKNFQFSYSLQKFKKKKKIEKARREFYYQDKISQYKITQVNSALATYQPLLVTLKTLWFKLFDSNNHTRSRPHSSKCMFINPSFKYITKPSFSKKTVGTEVSSGVLQLIKREGFHIRGRQYFTSRSGSRKTFCALITVRWKCQLGTTWRNACLAGIF